MIKKVLIGAVVAIVSAGIGFGGVDHVWWPLGSEGP